MWVLFSDDDDIWSERRHATYMREIAAAPTFTQSLLCRRKAVARTGADEPTDGDGVRALLRAGQLRFTDCNLRDGLAEDEHNMAEYFDMCVRLSVIRSFFATVPTLVSQHRLCDLAFCFLFKSESSSRANVRFMPTDDDFVYLSLIHI